MGTHYKDIGKYIGYTAQSCCASVSKDIGYTAQSCCSASVSEQSSKLEQEVLIVPLTEKDKIELKKLFQRE